MLFGQLQPTPARRYRLSEKIEKFEGGFSKALRLHRADGTELIAKIPCLNAGSAKYTTAGEVAVLQYAREHTDIPVPCFYAWSADASNPVGAEYIIMDTASGVQLFRLWDRLEEQYKLAIIQKLVKWESQLMLIKFPAYGCVYPRHFLPDNERKADLPTDIDQSGSYCIGRPCDPAWSGVPEDVTLGPWLSLTDFGIVLAKRGIYCISQDGKGVHTGSHRGTPAEHIFLLETTIKVMEVLGTHSDLLRHSKPTLCHTDLHMGNIFVSEDDPSQTSAVVDWQFTQIGPMFLQARWPVFLTPPKDYQVGIVKPRLPDDYEDLDEEGKQEADHRFEQATTAKAYELRCFLDNKDAYDAMHLPRVYRELFMRYGNTWEEGPAPLRACLLAISNAWDELDLPSECPYTWQAADIQKHEQQFEEYQEWRRARDFAEEYLGTDADGWIPPEIDFNKKQEQNKALFALYAEQMAGQMSQEEISMIWPFPSTEPARSPFNTC
ncbi:hypothetical protein A1O7_06432 [Cladophialophora yegresii CBS 114405]|uniref:Altered inheritance of mitochondria protein 9, mitochondrial n=1 Tax=Cladophialophora yegresii CBS 114405 TaxID=1182544 RepID=W9W386_9EURO|nr:uncharacterized protein A1O7_06432 [Cladophialophora yegresii CBS 114405]EXJ59001.1 hypothetical protein A1O7_06432 [Cladophialophora yegresii CBS 114405]